MPIRGENIGAAFVRLIIDGDKVPRDVESALKDADGEFDAAGKRQGEAHAKALRRSMTENGLTNKDADEFTEKLRNRIDAGMETLGKDSGTSFFERFRKSVIAEMGDGRLADQMIANFERDFARSGFKADFTNLFGVDEDSTRANAEATKEWTARIQEATVALQKQDKELERDVDLLRRRLTVMRSETERVTSGQLRDFEHLGDALSQNREHVISLDRELVRLRNNLSPAEFREFNREINAMNRQLSGNLNATIITYDRNINRVGVVIGKVFGRGSRSELLNFFGVLAERGTRAFLSIGSAALKTVGVIGDFITGFRNAADGTSRLASGFSAAFARLGPQIAALANPAGIAAAIAAVLALSIAMGALASVVVSLVGVLGALISTLAGALVGALGLAAGALLPLVAGIGVTVAAFKSLDEAGKASLKESLQPVVDKFKELGKIAGENIFESLRVGAESLTAAFDTFAITQFVDQISIAIGTVIEGFAAAVASPGFQTFVETLTNTLPEQIVNLGFATQQFAAGFGGVLLALQPSITSMSEGLANIAMRFNEWANSAAGQTALTDFFEKAQEALSAIGGLVWAVGEALIEMFNGEAGTIGIEIFDAIQKKVEQFVDYLRDPKNKDEIDKFFRDAKEIAGQLWEIMLDLIGAFKTFGGEENRADLKRILDAVKLITGAVEALADAISEVNFSDILNLPAFGFGVGNLDISGFGGGNAEGTRNWQGGWSWVGEEGPELVKIPGGSNIYSTPESMAMAGGRDVEININNYGPQSSADIKRQIEWNLRYGGAFGPSTVMAG